MPAFKNPRMAPSSHLGALLGLMLGRSGESSEQIRQLF